MVPPDPWFVCPLCPGRFRTASIQRRSEFEATRNTPRPMDEDSLSLPDLKQEIEEIMTLVDPAELFPPYLLRGGDLVEYIEQGTNGGGSDSEP